MKISLMGTSRLMLTASLFCLFTTQSACGQPGNHSGSLSDSDPTLDEGEFYDTFPIQVNAGEWIEVDMTSNDFDTYLVLMAPSGQNEQNDDYEGSTSRSYLRMRAEESGTWNVYATSYAGGEKGNYRIAINVGDGSQVVCSDCNTSIMQTSSSDDARIEHGELSRGDNTLTSGEYVDSYTVQGRAGEQLIVDLRSSDFDPYLILKLSDDEQIDNDDHEGDLTRSLITTELPTTGTYQILVTSYSEGETGSYDLTIRGGGGENGTTYARASGVRTERGTLASGDSELRSGEYYDIYTFEGAPGQRIRIDLESSEFDTYLGLQPPRGEAIQDDDGGGSVGHSVIEMDLTEPGTYQVFVTSYAAKETGAYSLTMDFSNQFGGETQIESNNTDPTFTLPASLNASELTLNRSFRGSLESSDRRLSSGEFVDLHVFDGEANEPVRIEMRSTDFDTYLLVTTPSGEVIQNDDFDGSTGVSRVEMLMPMDGRYRIEATSYAAGETGSYSIEVSQAGAMAADPPQYNRIAGLFVGISDYGGRQTNLAYTASDATRVRDALVEGAGMNPSDAIVLTDAAATRSAFRNSIRELASRTDDNTLFVLFYSGHGGQYDRAGGPQSSDPDGMDESLELYDGEILDDELNELLSQLRANNQLIVLDACYSGGFAKDIISVPGRMGLFSSEEDVLSFVAAKFEAGGYLSRFFSDALVQRDADEDRNGAITPLEISQYLRTRYAGDVRNDGLEAIVAGENRLGHQNLVVDRGSLGAFSTLFVLQ